MQVDEEMKKAVGLNDGQCMNQFPFEACLVMKHHLADTVQKVIIIVCIFMMKFLVTWSDGYIFIFTGLWIS